MEPFKIWPQSEYKFTYYSWLKEATVANVLNNRIIWISCIDKALLSDGKNTIQQKQLLEKSYSNSAPLETTIKKWYADFKCCLHQKYLHCLPSWLGL